MSIDFFPQTKEAEIAQNVSIITRIRQGTQPLDRDLGIDAAYLDTAGTRGQALLAATIVDQLPQQEPRIEVKGVTFSGDTEHGQYSPTIEYEVTG